MVDVGMIRNQTAWVRDILEDPSKTGVVVVSLPEDMPVTETAELLAQIPKEVRTPVLGIIANRVIDVPDDAELERLASHADDGVKAATTLWLDLARAERPYVKELQELGPATVIVPLIGFDNHDLAATRAVADALQNS
jgi:anion-transporting  ArsA/GET3 family ATPase